MSKCTATFTCTNCGKKFNIEANGIIKFAKKIYKIRKQHRKECR